MALREGAHFMFLTGAPRTGTHMANAIISSCEGVQPILTEASPLIRLIERAHKTLTNSAKRNPGNFFEDSEDAFKTTLSITRIILDQVASRYNYKLNVLRGPMLLNFIDLMDDIEQSTEIQFSWVIMIRDPRDAYCSFKTWNQKRVDRTGVPIDEDIFEYFLKRFKSSYAQLNGRDASSKYQIHRYEDVTRDPANFVEALNKTIDPQLVYKKPVGKWRNSKADFNLNENISADAITPLYDSPINTSSIGRFADELSTSEIEKINEKLGDLMLEFGYSE